MSKTCENRRGGIRFTLYLFVLCVCVFNALNSLSYATEAPQLVIKKSSLDVWQRQQILITIQAETIDSFARLEAEDFQQKGFSIIAYPFERNERDNKTQLVLKWAVFPFISGEQELKLPDIIFRPNRGRKKVLNVKALKLRVRKLPIYIPPTMPVGKIRLESSWQQGKIIFTKKLLEWSVKVTGDSVVAQTMPSISQQVLATKFLQVLPIKRSQKTLMNEKGIVSQREYVIPLKAVINGIFSLPKIEVQYFEPISGKLEKVSLIQPLRLSLHKWLFWLMVLVLFSLLAWILWEGSTMAKTWLSVFIKRKQAITLFSKAENYQQIRSAVNQLSLLEGWEANLSLTTFIEKWERKFGRSIALKEKINNFQMQYFSAGSDNVNNNK